MNKFVGTGPSPYKKNNLPGRGLTQAEKHWRSRYTDWCTSSTECVQRATRR